MVKMHKDSVRFLCLFAVVVVEFVWRVDSGYQYPEWDRVNQRKPLPDKTLYFIRQPPLNFAGAMASCAVDGLVLSEFATKDEVTALNKYLVGGAMPRLDDPNDFVFYIYVGCMYIGRKEDGTGPFFQWFESGRVVTNDSWWKPPDQPDTFKGADETCCVAFRTLDGDWGIGDVSCLLSLPYICTSIPNDKH